MRSPADWEGEVKGMLKAEVKRRNLTYEQLAAKLAEIGVQDTPRNIINKINRGSFSPCSSYSAYGLSDAIRCRWPLRIIGQVNDLSDVGNFVARDLFTVAINNDINIKTFLIDVVVAMNYLILYSLTRQIRYIDDWPRLGINALYYRLISRSLLGLRNSFV